MKRSKQGTSYVRALMELGEQDSITQRLEKELETLAKLDGDTLSVLQSPMFSKDEKKVVLEEIFRNFDLHPYVRGFLQVTTDAQLLHLLPSMAGMFSDLLLQKRGGQKIEVFTAQPLSAAQLKRLTQRLDGGKELKVVQTVDPQLLGGVKVKIGSLVFDNTIRHLLESWADETRRALAQA